MFSSLWIITFGTLYWQILGVKLAANMLSLKFGGLNHKLPFKIHYVTLTANPLPLSLLHRLLLHLSVSPFAVIG